MEKEKGGGVQQGQQRAGQGRAGRGGGKLLDALMRTKVQNYTAKPEGATYCQRTVKDVHNVLIKLACAMRGGQSQRHRVRGAEPPGGADKQRKKTKNRKSKRGKKKKKIWSLVAGGRRREI